LLQVGSLPVRIGAAGRIGDAGDLMRGDMA